MVCASDHLTRLSVPGLCSLPARCACGLLGLPCCSPHVCRLCTASAPKAYNRRDHMRSAVSHLAACGRCKSQMQSAHATASIQHACTPRSPNWEVSRCCTPFAPARPSFEFGVRRARPLYGGLAQARRRSKPALHAGSYTHTCGSWHGRHTRGVADTARTHAPGHASSPPLRRLALSDA